MAVFANYRAFVGAHPEKVFKATLFQSARLLLGLNCLEPGQEQPGKGERRKLKGGHFRSEPNDD